MMQTRSYQVALCGAILLHLSMIVLLLSEHSTDRPVLKLEAKNEPGRMTPEMPDTQEEAIKAVSVDNQEVMQTVNRLKQERLQQQQAELNRQRALKQQAEMARQQRIAEQQRIERLKTEAAKLALARQKQMAAEQQRLKELAAEKQKQEQHLAQMKQQQQQEAQKLAELQQKKSAELARAKQAQIEKEKMELAKKQQAAAQQAAQDVAQAAKVAGEVDKYKAMIINAISRQWILPENVDRSLSSQFRIHLAPNGAVMEVSLVRSSGDAILDRSAQAAIYKASPLPVPTDPATFNLFRDISLTVRPMSARG